MSIKPADDQRLAALFAQHNATYGGRKEDYFAVQHLVRRFETRIEDIAHQVAFGGNDYGIDAYFIDRRARNLYLYQFKWTEDHGQFKSSMERLSRDGIARVFGNPLQDAEQNALLTYLKKDLREHREMIDRVYVHFVFKGDPDAVEKSEGLSQRREEIDAKAHLIHQFFGRDSVGFEVDFIADRPGRRGPPPRQAYPIRLANSAVTMHGGTAMYVGFVPLIDLHQIHRNLGQYFFDRNIRAGLSPDNPPNRKLREAFDRIVLKEADDPSVFAFRHNGVTLAAERVEQTEDGLLLHVPRLLNGAQTVSTLTRFLEQHVGNALLRRNSDRLDALKVLAKVVVDDPASDFVTQVTISNNQQNPVHPWTLRAMDRRQVDFADKFRDEVQIYYSRQEGAFANLTDDDLEELGIESDKDIRIKNLAMTFLALQGDLANMKNLPEVFESQRLYDATFKASYLHADARAIVLLYKAGQMIRPVMQKLTASAPAKIKPGIPKAKNLVWALLLQALLNARNYEDLVERYGGDLKKEFAFGDVLKTMASSRIIPILKEVCGVPVYRAKVEEGTFEFFRTTEAFKRAMDFAGDRFEWSKRSI